MRQFLAEFADGPGLAGQDEIGPDLGQRMKDKAAQMHPWMGQLELWLVEHSRPVIEQVEIDRARMVRGVLRWPAQFGFDFLQFLEQFLRQAGITNLHHRVEKFLRRRFALDRIGFVNRRGEERGRNLGQSKDSISRCR